MPNIALQLPPAPPIAYDALVERGCLARLGDHIRPYLTSGARVVLVTTPNVRRLWGAAAERGLAGLPFTLLELPDGEPHKTLADLERLAETMVAAGCDRDTLLIALGGGVVGDLAAFLASIYMRGVSLIQVPTTLLAMIDSSLGGKTAVNLAGGKNLIGTFHHPRLILVDPDVLATLPEREFRAGMAEAVKYGVIGDPALFAQLEVHPRPDSAALDTMIAACLCQKAEVVAADEREGDRRRVLNFGHTLGHALESVTGYHEFLHGEAVAWGMIAAGAIAVDRGMFAPADAARMNATILAACGPLPPISAEPEAILRHAASDKKARAGVLHFVLPTALGRVEVVRDIPRAQILAALATIAPKGRIYPLDTPTAPAAHSREGEENRPGEHS